ncbi:MAG: hypothetical protein RhofKO_10630 [Rhodothermales bacterium]
MSRIRNRIDKLHEQHTQQQEGFTLPAGTRISDEAYDAEAYAVTVGMGTDRESMSGEEYHRRYPRGLLIELRTRYPASTPLSDRVQPMNGYERTPKLPGSTEGGRGGYV